jgi:serine/threonine-protein kinase HipA
MSERCLYCYENLAGETDFHESCSLKFFGKKVAPRLQYSLKQMSELAKEVVERSVSVPGVQAKLSMSLVEAIRGTTDTRLTIVGALGGNYIFKPPSEEYKEMPPNEHLTMRMAESFGIEVVPSSLIRLQSGELSYITRRIDRDDNGGKIHMLDMFQIMEAYDKYKNSMEKIGKALGAYSSNPLLDKLFLFERTIFAFLTGNNDMHLKNFSMIEGKSGWVLSPAYDLLNVSLVLPEDTEELALPLEGKKKKFRKAHFEQFGKGLGLTDRQIEGVFRRFLKAKPIAESWVERSFLSDDFKAGYLQIMLERYDRIYAPSPAAIS